MKRLESALVLLLAVALPLKAAASQSTAPMPELDELRAWIQAHHPNLMSGDSGVNGAIIIVDTNAQYVRSIALRLSADELEAVNAGVARAASLTNDTTLANLLNACVGGEPPRPAANRPICMLDGARVPDIDGLHFFASHDLDVLKGEAAAKQYGADASAGAVLVRTDSVALARYTQLGATPANFVSFETRRIRRRADGQPVAITVLMLRDPKQPAPIALRVD